MCGSVAIKITVAVPALGGYSAKKVRARALLHMLAVHPIPQLG